MKFKVGDMIIFRGETLLDITLITKIEHRFTYGIILYCNDSEQFGDDVDYASQNEMEHYSNRLLEILVNLPSQL